MSALSVERVGGAPLLDALPALAALRIEVFREYPYLYEGSLAYEERYLASYADSAESVVVLARDGDTVVGASTALPLAQHGEGLAPVFEAAGIAPDRVFYFGESVLKRAYRGRGVGNAFFDEREAAAREHGFSITAFCAVERPAGHPLCPPDYVPHAAFWNKRGYVRTPALHTQFSWRDVGERRESEKRMVFWLKELAP